MGRRPIRDTMPWNWRSGKRVRRKLLCTSDIETIPSWVLEKFAEFCFRREVHVALFCGGFFAIPVT